MANVTVSEMETLLSHKCWCCSEYKESRGVMNRENLRFLLGVNLSFLSGIISGVFVRV